MCLETLSQHHQSCLLSRKQQFNYLSISTSVNQDTNEKIAQQLVQSLVQTPDMCRYAIMDLICSRLFPLCDGNGTIFGPSIEVCVQISTVDCTDIWQKTLALPGLKGLLSDCSSFPASSLVCKGKHYTDMLTICVHMLSLCCQQVCLWV